MTDSIDGTTNVFEQQVHCNALDSKYIAMPWIDGTEQQRQAVALILVLVMVCT